MKQDLEARTEEYAHIQDIAGIPAAITDEHNDVYYHWEKSGIQDAALFHIDKHPDTDSTALSADFSSYKDLTIADFICAAVHRGIVSSMYWYEPHDYPHLLDMGSTNPDNRKSLNTNINKGYVLWEDESLDSGNGDAITTPEIQIPGRFILDIDLDAFCSVHEEEGYEERIDKTIEVLKTLKRPDLITITRSQGPPLMPPVLGFEAPRRFHVNPDKVDDVQAYLLEKLNELYGEK
jgi:hypothetical protein